MKRTDESIADGGSIEGESIFEVVSDSELTREERMRLWLDQVIIGPARVMRNDMRAVVGGFIVMFYIAMGTIGVRLIDKPDINGPSLLMPFQSWQYPLGTDALGQSILSLLVHATPPMLLMLASGALFTTAVATVVGTVSGYKGGLVDQTLVLITDIMMSIPGLPLIIVVAVIFAPKNPIVVGILLSINAWAGLARSIRSQVLTLRDKPYVESSRTMDVSTSKIVAGDLLPNLMPYIAVNFVASGRRVIFNSVALYFIGALPFSQLNWGVVLNMAYRKGALYTWQGLHWILAPLITILLLTVGLILLAQGTERIFNPRIRAQHESIEDESIPETH